MANYSDLKAAVAAVIKTNGNNEITGAILQSTLLTIIDSLGKYPGYLGVVTPDTVPGTPDENVFYLTNTPGTYVNFGGLIVPDDGLYSIRNNELGVWILEKLLNKPSNSILDWIAGTYVLDNQRFHNGQIWTVVVPSTNQEPGVGSDWEPNIDLSDGQDSISILENLSDVFIRKGLDVDITGIVWTDKTFINSAGTVSSTVAEVSSSSYIDLPYDGIYYEYFGDIGRSGLCIALFPQSGDTPSVVIPQTAVGSNKKRFLFFCPIGSSRVRVSCSNPDIPNFKLKTGQTIIRLKVDFQQMLLDEQFGINSITLNVDDVLESAQITWRDGTEGVITMSDYNTDFISFDSYSITYLGDTLKTLIQPKVTRDIDGNIINKPNKQII